MQIVRTSQFQEAMADLPDRSSQLTLTDPPYNIGHDYGPINDRLPADEYRQMMRDLASLCYQKTAEDGSLFIIHYPEFFLENAQVFQEAGWRLHQWITWCYPSNVGHSRRRFTRSSRALVWWAKNDFPKFVHKAVTQPYRNPQDRRIKALMAQGAKGAALYDWWDIDLCKNVSAQKRAYSNQIPERLLENVILSTTDPGDLVVDPFCGTGSTLRTAHRLQRDFWGCDANPEASRFWDDLQPTSK